MAVQATCSGAIPGASKARARIVEFGRNRGKTGVRKGKNGDSEEFPTRGSQATALRMTA